MNELRTNFFPIVSNFSFKNFPSGINFIILFFRKVATTSVVILSCDVMCDMFGVVRQDDFLYSCGPKGGYARLL